MCVEGRGGLVAEEGCEDVSERDVGEFLVDGGFEFVEGSELGGRGEVDGGVFGDLGEGEGAVAGGGDDPASFVELSVDGLAILALWVSQSTCSRSGSMTTAWLGGVSASKTRRIQSRPATRAKST